MDLTTPLEALLTQLEAAGLFASMDPAAVNTPGGWLAIDELRVHNVAGNLQLRCSLYLITDDTDPLRAVAKLAELHTTALTVLTPDGPVLTQGVVLPDTPTPLPALRVPVYLYTESE